jgi:LacI family transcriptional regulator
MDKLRRHAPTLDDVARAARVSTATVSRCLNAPARLRPETRARVEQAIAALGYTPHFGGRALASNRTNTVGVVIPTMENAIFARGVQAMEETLAEAGATLLIATSGYDPEREAAQVAALLGRGVDGLILIGRVRPQATVDLIARRGAPCVLAWTDPGSTQLPCVGFDNRAAARAMAERVLRLGHRRVAMIAGRTRWNDRAAERLQGARDALAAAGLTLHAVEAAYTLEAGASACNGFFADGVRPTAVLCGNDVLAAGALIAARRRGLRTPEDVSITGFDDIDLAEATNPGLTTVRVPHDRMGRAAAETLLALRDGLPAPKAAALETVIVERGSLGPPPAAGRR